MPHGREAEGLHLPPVPEAVNGEQRRYLGVLKQAGLVCNRHEGRQTHYGAQLGALAQLIDWTSQMAGFWQSRFCHLEDLLKRIDR